MQINKETKLKAVKKIFEQDIEEFGKFFFPHHLRLEVPKFHREIYQLFQSEEKRIAIGAPRSFAKSTLTDLVYLAWVIVSQKARFILLISDTYSQAVLFLEALKAELEANEKLIGFYGKLKSDSWSEGEIITNGIMIKALGAGMKVRGLKYRESRPDCIVCDDLENDELVENKERREKMERWFNGALIPCLDKNGKIIIIGTILHYDSLLFKLLCPDKYTEWHKNTYQAIQKDGSLLWEEHLNQAELNIIKRQYIEKGQGYLFYQEYQNDPISDENRKFKLEKIKYYEDKEIEGRLLAHFIAIDRAYSTEKTADATGIVVIAVDLENRWYIKIAERFRGEEQALINKIFDLKNFFNPDKIGIEQKAFKYTLKPTLENEMRKRNNFFSVEELKDSGISKHLRIEGLLPRFESGSIYFKREQTDLIDEMIKFPKAGWDDLIDGLSYCNQIASPPNSNLASEQVEEYDEKEYGLMGLN